MRISAHRALPKNLFLCLITAFTTSWFPLLGAPFVRVLRNHLGSLMFWVAGISMSVGLWLVQKEPLALLLLSVWSVVGLYCELEFLGLAGRLSALISIVFACGIFIGGLLYWSHRVGFNLIEVLNNDVDQILTHLGSVFGTRPQWESRSIVELMPALVANLILVCLAFSLIAEKPAASILGVNFEVVAGRMPLLEFNLPDICIWMAMFSALFTFVHWGTHTLHVVSANVFIFSLTLYYFQGLAVTEVLFRTLRTSQFWKTFFYFFVVIQLYFILVMVAVGVIDYWANFRALLRRNYRSERNQNHEGNL